MVHNENLPSRVTHMSTSSLHADAYLNEGPDVAPVISTSSTYLFNKHEHGANNYGKDQWYEYSRYGTPTLARAEAVISKLTHGFATVHSSGLSSLFSLLIHFRPTRIIMKHGYFGSDNVVSIYRSVVPEAVVLGLDCEYKENDFVWLETPVNPTGEIEDIQYFANKAHAVNARLVVDSTFAPPPLCDPFKHGADIVMHSGTKYFAGHADVLCGVVIVKCSKTNEALHRQRDVLGDVPGNLESWLLLRSLRTLELRVLQQSKTCQMLVSWLANGAKGSTLVETDGIPVGSIVSVKHASTQTFSPSFDVCNQHPHGFGPVFSILFSSKEQALYVARNLKLTTFATSLGAVVSLVDWRHGGDSAQDPRLLRVSIGLENIEDLKNDWRSTIVASESAIRKNKL
ncbi:putative trans-sulfuration enzyme [Smittium mucronatum]|uniref:Putative trans-sulfuration enzyme n=1 Tax=Smittium mucronatum TaxID=133383 RepID=A0A1R0H344_9FUNG|nr:putative trans-sulfuration enzyme [Smittium mucronatum]